MADMLASLELDAGEYRTEIESIGEITEEQMDAAASSGDAFNDALNRIAASTNEHVTPAMERAGRQAEESALSGDRAFARLESQLKGVGAEGAPAVATVGEEVENVGRRATTTGEKIEQAFGAMRWTRLVGAFALIRTGLLGIEGGVAEVEAHSELAAAEMSGDYEQILRAELKVQAANEQLVRSVPILGTIVAAAMRHWGDREGVELALKNIESIRKATEEMEKESVQLHRDAALEKAKADGKSAADIAEMKAGFAESDTEQKVEHYQDEVTGATKLYEDSVRKIEVAAGKQRFLPQAWDIEGWKKIQAEYEAAASRDEKVVQSRWAGAADLEELLARTRAALADREAAQKAFDDYQSASAEKQLADADEIAAEREKEAKKAEGAAAQEADKKEKALDEAYAAQEKELEKEAAAQKKEAEKEEAQFEKDLAQRQRDLERALAEADRIRDQHQRRRQAPAATNVAPVAAGALTPSGYPALPGAEAAAAAPLPVAAGEMYVTVNINTPVGTNVRELARLVLEEIERLRGRRHHRAAVE